jgi:hypothetical protein
MLVHDHGCNAIHSLLKAERGVLEVKFVGRELVLGPCADGEHVSVIGEAGMCLNVDLLQLRLSYDSIVVVLAEAEPFSVTLLTLINDHPQDAILVEHKLKL